MINLPHIRQTQPGQSFYGVKSDGNRESGDVAADIGQS